MGKIGEGSVSPRAKRITPVLHANDINSTAPTMPDTPLPDAMKVYFREKYPIMLDGALMDACSQGHLLRQARESLATGKVDPDRLPAPILRETLEQILVPPHTPTTQAGLTPVGPGSARVWWDGAITDNVQDVIVHLDKPRSVLRFYDVTGLDPEAGRWHESFDVDIDLHDLGHTVSLWSNDRVYVVDLGYIYADGRFLRLARTNAVRIPRDKAGQPEDGGAGEARSVLRRHEIRDRALAPDQAARDWVAARADFAERDLEAEMVVHMLYRAFLREGPRALRRSPRIVRQGDAVLRQEFAQRQRRRHRAVAVDNNAATSVLVARLDAGTTLVAPRIRYLPAPMTAARSIASLGPDAFAWFQELLSAARSGTGAEVRRIRALPEPVEALPTLVRRMEPLEPAAISLLANPVFEAARNLRDGLSAMAPLAEDDLELVADVSDAFAVDSPERFGGHGDAMAAFGGAEAKRMAKAGVRITRMALTLEGRMRPGARLKVAGRLVHADAQGRFRLECVLTGKRASIPMRAGTSIEGEARSLINVDWERRAASDKRKVYQ